MAGLCPGTTHRSQFRCHRCFVSMRQQWFTHVRLLIAHLPRYSETSPAALTTPALDRRSLRWFGISACTATPEDLPPSLAQHGSCRRSSTSSSLPFRTHVGAGNSAVVVDLPRCGPMLSPRVPNLVPIPGPWMERETPGQRPRPNYSLRVGLGWPRSAPDSCVAYRPQPCRGSVHSAHWWPRSAVSLVWATYAGSTLIVHSESFPAHTPNQTGPGGMAPSESSPTSNSAVHRPLTASSSTSVTLPL